jgi:hypothetical protein
MLDAIRDGRLDAVSGTAAWTRYWPGTPTVYTGPRWSWRSTSACVTRAERFPLTACGPGHWTCRPAVRVVVESVLAGASLRSVARSLNAIGLTTSMKGRVWDAHSVRAVLLRSRNAGLRAHQGQVIGPANWPAIVPEEQWRAVVTKLSDPSRRTSPSDARVKWLGSGIHRCAGCERPSLRVSTAGVGIPCYRCPGQRGATGHVVRKAGPLDALHRCGHRGTAVPPGRHRVVATCRV